MQLNRSNTAQKLNISLTTLDDWRRKGCPYSKRGKQVFFNLDELKTWLDERACGELNYTQERAKLTKLQAEKVSLELDQQRGSLIPMELAIATWQGHIGNARAKLLALPPKVAGQVITMDSYREIEQLVTSLIHEALDELESDEFSEEQKTHIAPLAKELEEVY
jgi:phage terminase Nu1 subunit (DNA packaging protein)